MASTPFRGLGSSPRAWGAPNKGNADGAVSIFGNAGCVWAPTLRPDPPKKGLVPHLPADHHRSAPLQVPGSISAGRVICSADLAKCVSVPGDFLRPQGTFPPDFYPLRGVLSPGPWDASNKENADEAVGIFGNAWRVWAPVLRSDPLKKGLVPHMPVRWGEQQVPQINVGVIRTVRDFSHFLCNSIFFV